MSRWAQIVALGLAQLTGRQSLSCLHREQPEQHQAQALSLGRRDDGQSLVAGGLRQCRAAVHPLRNAVWTPAWVLSRSAVSHAAPKLHELSVGREEQACTQVDATTGFVFGGLPVGRSFQRRTKARSERRAGSGAGHLPSFVSVTEGKTGDVKAPAAWTCSSRQLGDERLTADQPRRRPLESQVVLSDAPRARSGVTDRDAPKPGRASGHARA